MKLSQYNFRLAAVLALALFAVMQLGATQASAYRQNVTCDNGRNACGSDDEAKPIVWDRSCILFYMDEGGSNDFPLSPEGKAGPALTRIVEESFAAWTRPDCSGVNLIYGGMKSPDSQQVGERQNMVTFKQEGWSQTSAMTFATTVVNYNPRTGVIREADIKVNDQFYRQSTQESPGPGEADLQNTLTHEVGHFLGMAHTDVEEATMFGSADLGETKKRTLHRDDIDGLCNHYPVSDYSSTCGEGDEDEDDSDGKGDLVHDGGEGSFAWGSRHEQPTDDAACSVTGTWGSAMLNPIMLIVGLFGGVLWRRRSRPSSGG